MDKEKFFNYLFCINHYFIIYFSLACLKALSRDIQNAVYLKFYCLLVKLTIYFWWSTLIVNTVFTSHPGYALGILKQNFVAYLMVFEL